MTSIKGWWTTRRAQEAGANRETVQELADALRSAQSVSSWEQSVMTQTDVAFFSLRRNAVLNFFVRIALYAVALIALAYAVYYVGKRADDMVGVLINLGDGSAFDLDRFLALTVPVGLLFLLGAAAMIAALAVQTRGAGDFESGLASMSRLRREAEAGVSRSRSVPHVLEDFLTNSRRTLALQLWLNRALFATAFAFLAIAVIESLAENTQPIISLSFGAGSVVVLLLGLMGKIPKQIGNHLSDSAQTLLAVTNATREFNLVEEFGYKTLEAHKTNPERCRSTVEACIAQMRALTRDAIELIEEYTEPRAEPEEQPGHQAADEKATTEAADTGPEAPAAEPGKNGSSGRAGTDGGDHGNNERRAPAGAGRD